MHDGDMSAEQFIDQVATPRQVVAKAYEIGNDREPFEKAAQQSGETDANVAGLTANYAPGQLEPPYDPGTLCRLFEHSSALRQNVDAYMTNIDGFGHAFDPVVQLREAGCRDLVRDAMYLEKHTAAAAGQPGAIDLVTMPTDVEIDLRIDKLRSDMRMEHAKVESFFGNCVAEESFTSLRRKTRMDLEVTGNGYWEIIRNDMNELAQFCHIPARSVRVVSAKSLAVDVPQNVRFGTLGFKKEMFRRRFRRYVQVGGDSLIWFKEFGDPSVVSLNTGKSYPDAAAFAAEEPNVPQATEVFHFKIHSLGTSAYGVPRWIGNLLSVLGSRAAEEVNLAYFDNKAIPPIAILVSGGRLGEESVKRIQDFVEVQIKGRKNFHKILVIEAETTQGAIGLGSENAGHMRVEIKQLTDAQLKDGLFLAYDSANMDKVGMGFRLPRLLRGDIRDFNRASAEAALDFAESQVFVPERNDFDFAMNRHFLSTLGIRYWRFKSNGPRLSDSQSWGEMIAKLTVAGILTPEDGRALAGTKVLSQELPVIDADWIKQPLALTIAGVQLDAALDDVIPLRPARQPAAEMAPPSGSPLGPEAPIPALSLVAAAKNRIARRAKELIQLRDAFRKQEAAQLKQEGEQAAAAFQTRQLDDGEEVFKMTAEEMARQFHITPK